MKTNRIGSLAAVAGILFLWTACAVMPIGVTRSGYALFVAPNGNDAWSGIHRSPTRDGSDGPFATIERARDAIRLLIEKKELKEPVTVYIREGMYTLKEPLVFTPKDSGTQSCPITYRAYPDETPVVSAGREVRLEAVSQDGRVLRGKVASWAEAPWVFHQLFVNGERRIRSRTPNEGYNQTVGEISNDPYAKLTFRGEDIRKEWADRGDVEFVSVAKWSDYRIPLLSVDEDGRTAALSRRMIEHIRESDQRYFLENVPGGVDQPGEWYLDGRTGELTYQLADGEEFGRLTMIAPVHEQAVRLEGHPETGELVENLHFVGLTFGHTEWKIPKEGYAGNQAAHQVPGGFYARGATGCSVERCTLAQLGGYAVEFSQGCKNNRIVGNHIYDIGAGGVKIGEESIRTEEALQTTGTTVSDNHIHQLGRVFTDGIGVWIAQSAYNTVAHNHIHDLYYTGISVGWTWGYDESNAHHNTIEYNLVHDIGQFLLSDMGGIYLLGRQPGTVVRNNVFHDVNSFSYGGWGIYTDEGSTGILIENNITYRTKSAGFHQHYGRENIVRNNIFAYGKEYQVMRTRVEPHVSFTFENNIVYFDEGQLLGSNWSENNYKFDKNVYWNPNASDFKFSEWTWEEWKAKGQDAASVIADPLFRDPENNDFSLEKDSPALPLGFQPIEVKTVGPREEPTGEEFPERGYRR